MISCKRPCCETG